MNQYFRKAQWVWSAEAAPINAYVRFEQTFSLEAAVSNAVLRISADAQYAAFLNGELVGAGQYADYPAYKTFDEYQVGQRLRAGENRLEVVGYCPVTESSVYRLGTPGVLFEITAGPAVLAWSKAGMDCAPHGQYRSGEIEKITGQLGYSFEYDAQGISPAFCPAVPVNGPETLYPRPVQQLKILPRQSGTLKTVGIWQAKASGTPGWRMQHDPIAWRGIQQLTDTPSHTVAGSCRPSLPSEAGVRFHSEEDDGVYLLVDLEAETAGWLDLEIEVSERCEILIGWGEHTDDLRLRTAVGGRNFGARYLAKPGRQRFTNLFKRSGLRYVELFVRSHTFRLYYAGVLPTVYPLSDLPSFRTADRLHSLIYEACRETLRHCVHEHYEDCPWREQALYAMDSRNQMLCGYYAFGEYDMPRASIRLLALGMREDHLLELCAPARVPITIPSFSAMFVVELQEYMLFSGDADFSREMLPYARAIADEFLARRNPDGLIPAWQGAAYWNFYEWQPYLEGYQKHDLDTEAERLDAPMNCFAALALARLADLMRMLGEDGTQYQAAADALRKATHQRFWDEDKGLYYSFANRAHRWHEAQLTQALAVYAGVCPEACVDSVLPLLTDDRLVPVTLSYSVFQFDALMRRPEQYSRWVFDRVARDWGNMLRQNATTFWETMVGADDFSDAGSLCHGWSAVPLYLYFAYALGIRPEQAGFHFEKTYPVECGLYELGGRILLPNGQTREF